MLISGWQQIFLVGCLGGFVGEIGRWFELRTSPNLPDYVRRWLYWVATVLMILAGGGLAIAYGTESKSAILVANIGLSAPLIIKGLAAVNPIRPGSSFAPGRTAPSLARFLAGR